MIFIDFDRKAVVADQVNNLVWNDRQTVSLTATHQLPVTLSQLLVKKKEDYFLLMS